MANTARRHALHCSPKVAGRGWGTTLVQNAVAPAAGKWWDSPQNQEKEMETDKVRGE